jgi:hypothetical protein
MNNKVFFYFWVIQMKLSATHCEPYFLAIDELLYMLSAICVASMLVNVTSFGLSYHRNV